jgi:gliding motility associated protien GldN
MKFSIKNISLTASALALSLVSMQMQAQVLDPSDDGIIPDPPKRHHENRVIEYPFLREIDMIWSTRHWERIVVKEKINLSLYYPEVPLPDRKSLFDVIIDGIINENTISEVFDDDRFTRPLTIEEVTNIIERIDTIFDPDDPSVILAIDPQRLRPKDVIAWDIKSDWYFDKQRGEMKNRIIGISPRVKDALGDTYNLFWIWFPDARYALSTHLVYNMHNNNARLSFDQLLHLRQFNSIIYKEENVYDRTIADYKRNIAMDMLLESQLIRENLRNKEHDMWEF